MNKNKSIKLPVILVLIIIILAIVLFVKIKNNNNEGSNLNNIYNNLTASESYIFTIKKNDKNKTIMAKKGEKTAIDQYTNSNHTTTIVKEGNTYLILHDRKEYYVYFNNNVEQSILTDGIHELIGKDYTTGKEKIKGKNYKYEEYATSTIFTISNEMGLDDNEVKTRFYFDRKGNLTYIKTIYEQAQEILEVNLSNNVEDTVFEIPSDYAEN